jgi:uncharacterized protein
MSVRLPEFIDPWHFAEIGKELSDHIRLINFPRLKEMLVDQEGEAEFLLRFYKGEKGRIHITGYVKALLNLECQRCLESVGTSIASEVDVVVVEGYDEAKLLSDEYEPLLAGDKRIRLNEVIEDELLLALPQVPMHQEDECKAAYGNFTRSSEHEHDESGEESPNPFAVLKNLDSEQN